MKKALLFFTLLFAAGSQVNAQPVKPNSLEHLNAVIHTYMNKHDTKTLSRKKEYILLFVELDSTGKAARVNMMVDENNKDSTYSAVRLITAGDIVGWRSDLYKNMVVVIPIVSPGVNNPSANTYLFQGIYDPIYIPQECSEPRKGQNYIFAPTLFYLWPSSAKSN